MDPSKRFYITTAIDYANGSPHLGHAVEKIGADVMARYHRRKGEAVHFVIGMDEHGQKVLQSAEAMKAAVASPSTLVPVATTTSCMLSSATRENSSRNRMASGPMPSMGESTPWRI